MLAKFKVSSVGRREEKSTKPVRVELHSTVRDGDFHGALEIYVAPGDLEKFEAGKVLDVTIAEPPEKTP